MAACIPLAAVLSFVVGARFAKRRTERRTQTLSAHDEAGRCLNEGNGNEVMDFEIEWFARNAFNRISMAF